MDGYLSIHELAGIALPTGEREGVFVMLKAYFDDSGTHDTSEVVVVGGLIGTVAQWDQFEKQWAEKLAKPLPDKPRLSAFHLSPCNARKDEFYEYSIADRDAVIHDFRKIIIDAGLISTASAIDKKAWDELVTGPFHDDLGDALPICIENCLAETLRIAGAHPEGDKIAVVLDKGIWSERIDALTKAFTYPMFTPRIASVTFIAVADALPLQGADVVATESYNHAVNVLRGGFGVPPRPHLRHFLDNMLAQALIVDRPRIAEMLATNFYPDGRRKDAQPS